LLTVLFLRHFLCGARLAALVACLVGAVTRPVRAFDPDLRLGVKGFVTLSGLPETEAPSMRGAPFSNVSAGAGFGAGLFGELHVSRLVGLELGALIQSNRLYFVGSQRDVDFEQRASFEQLRVPLLGKLLWHLGQVGELSFGLGPELIVGLGAHATSELTAVRGALSAANARASLNYLYQADSSLGLGLAFEIGASFYTLRFQIPVALRFAYNVLGPTAYTDRVVVDSTSQRTTFQAAEGFQFALCFGFALLIPPRKPPPPPADPVPSPDDPFDAM
jgi:hypothetical protein